VPISAPKNLRDRVRGQFARAQGVINSFACEWLDDAGGVANEEEISMSGWNWRTG